MESTMPLAFDDKENFPPLMAAVPHEPAAFDDCPEQLELIHSLDRPEPKPKPKPEPESVQIFDKTRVKALMVAPPHERDKQRLELVLGSEHQRPLSRYGEDYRARLDGLDETYANFGEVTQFLREMHSLSLLGDGCVRLPPMLLDGPPGVGKTAFAQELAKLWGTDFVSIHVAAEQTNCSLVGLDEIYEGSRTGQVFTKLVLEGATANPVIFLDELDKATTDSRYNFHDTLLNLLEPSSSASFQDLSVRGLPINARHVIWLATSNDKNLLPGYLRSRLKVFNIGLPTPAQNRKVIRSVYAQLLSSEPWGHALNPHLSDAVMRRLLPHTPREARELLGQACARAAFAERTYLVDSDIDPIVSQNPRIGFLH